ISNATVCRATVDLPKNEARAKRLKPGDKERLRELVKSGMSKYQAAKEIGMSPGYAQILTRELPSKNKGNRSLSESSANLLRRILKDGYFIPKREDNMSTHYHVLHQYFPILKVQVSNKTIYYLEDRKEEAFKGFLRDIGSKVVIYNKLRETARLFGVPLDTKMKIDLLGKNGENKVNIMKLSYESKRTLRRLNQQNNGFVGSFIHSELLRASSSECRLIAQGF
ncbi:MAG: hypothetical protein V1678_04775, partial [Candidatus Aenigmatarchaeota archaeon]